MSPADLRAALWEAMVERAETLHDQVVTGQRDADLAAAHEIERQVHALRTLVGAILVLGEADDAG